MSVAPVNRLSGVSIDLYLSIGVILKLEMAQTCS